MIWIGKKAATFEAGVDLARSILESGRAYEIFETICRAQGGDLAALPHATEKIDVDVPRDGFVFSVNTEQVGLASLVLGAGRFKSTDAIDPVRHGTWVKSRAQNVLTNFEELYSRACPEWFLYSFLIGLCD
jgi:thymidine phosphorylase